MSVLGRALCNGWVTGRNCSHRNVNKMQCLGVEQRLAPKISQPIRGIPLVGPRHGTSEGSLPLVP